MNNISRRVSAIEGVKATFEEAAGLNNRSSGLTISWDPAKLHITGEEVSEELINGRPRITLGGSRATTPGTTSISIRAFQMQPGQDKIVGDRIYEILSKKRDPKPPVVMKAPAANISGYWDLTVNFFSSTSQHTLHIQQDGNWLRGMHKADFSVREVTGTIDGSEVKLLSPGRRPAVSFIFQGNLSGDNISGKIDMGEFLTAEFTAKKNTTQPARVPIVFPSGRPMGN
jgi:D-glucosaminate-6-phosphate ammonia-lyase